MAKLINRINVNDILDFNTAKIEETMKRGRSLRETKKKLGIGKCRMYALKDENGKVTNNMDEIVRIAEKF